MLYAYLRFRTETNGCLNRAEFCHKPFASFRILYCDDHYSFNSLPYVN